jgi:aldehyde dehydrogenase (NAD+)
MPETAVATVPRYGVFTDKGYVVGSDDTFPVVNPDNQQIIAQCTTAGTESIESAVNTAQKSTQTWQKLAPAERERILLKCADALESARDTLTDLMLQESGSTLAKAAGEVAYGASLTRTAAGETRRLYGDTFPNDRPHRLTLVQREPLGVVAAISPFNSPLALLLKMIVFPLAAGNAVISKPSEFTPLTALKVAELFMEAGLPPGTLQVLTGSGAEVGARLVAHPGVNGIAFTGSTAAGIQIGQTAMTSMKRVQLELGGKNPLIVLADYPLELAVKIAAVGAFFHAGQICMSASRLIVERSIAREFAEALAAHARGLRLGDLRDPQTAYGPLISEKAAAKTVRHVQDARDHGAEILCGGESAGGWRWQPTVVWQPPRESLVWREETFGPVVGVVPADSLEQAIALANDSQYGLSAGILTHDMVAGVRAAREIRAGAVHIGSHPFQSDALAPVGGVGLSGVGRSGGHYSTEHFTELKWISVELGEAPRPF